MIQNFKPRLYQQTILATCATKNTLVVLPTGMGKTAIFLMLAAQRMNTFPQSKILFLGPTRPLIDQYYAVFEEYFDIDSEDMTIFTGMTPPKKRAELWKNAKIIIANSGVHQSTVMAESLGDSRIGNSTFRLISIGQNPSEKNIIIKNFN